MAEQHENRKKESNNEWDDGAISSDRWIGLIPTAKSRKICIYD
jgi:hypothetical protein